MLKELIAQFSIQIDGSDAPRWVMDTLIECSVENSIHLPDACVFRLHVDPIDDKELKALDLDVLREGKQIRVSGGQDTSALKQLFVGEITSIELDLNSFGLSSIAIRCLSRSHRLHRGRKRLTFLQKTDADIVKQVGEAAGFSVKAESTSIVHDWVMQNNQTDWEFLSLLAARNGYRLYLLNKDELHFKRVVDTGAETIDLVWGQNMRSFRPRISASPQVEEVIVRGWDMKTKSSVIGTSNQAPRGIPSIGDNSKGPAIGKKAFGSAKMVIVDRPVSTAEEAKQMAQSIFDEISGEFLEADGLCFAQPDLLPGKSVQVKNVGKRFSGSYFVTSTIHTYTPAEGYLTQFSVTGKRPSTLLALLTGSDLAEKTPLGSQIVIGIVTNLEDPDNLGRVKVHYPWLTEDQESDWVRISAPMAGGGRGFYFLPEIDDEVLVAFEHGDIHRPFIIGALWNGKDQPIEANSAATKGQQVVRRTIKTRIGHTLLFDDTDGKGEVRVTTCGKHHLTLDDKNQLIEFRTKDGRRVTLSDKDGEIVIVDKNAANKLTIKSSDDSMSLECAGNFSVKAGKQVSIESGAPMSLKSSATATIEASAVTTIKGSFVKINS